MKRSLLLFLSSCFISFRVESYFKKKKKKLTTGKLTGKISRGLINTAGLGFNTRAETSWWTVTTRLQSPPGLNRVTTQDPEDHSYRALLDVQGHIPTSFPERGWSTYWILQSWSYYVKINFGRHQHYTGGTQKQSRVVAVDSRFAIFVGAHTC